MFLKRGTGIISLACLLSMSRFNSYTTHGVIARDQEGSRYWGTCKHFLISYLPTLSITNVEITVAPPPPCVHNLEMTPAQPRSNVCSLTECSRPALYTTRTLTEAAPETSRRYKFDMLSHEAEENVMNN